MLPIKSVHDRFDIHLKPGVTYETLGSDLSTLYHLQLLIRLMGCRRVLEVGTYVGVSAMFLAEAVGRQGRVTTVEIGRSTYSEQRVRSTQKLPRVLAVVRTRPRTTATAIAMPTAAETKL